MTSPRTAPDATEVICRCQRLNIFLSDGEMNIICAASIAPKEAWSIQLVTGGRAASKEHDWSNMKLKTPQRVRWNALILTRNVHFILLSVSGPHSPASVSASPSLGVWRVWEGGEGGGVGWGGGGVGSQALTLTSGHPSPRFFSPPPPPPPRPLLSPPFPPSPFPCLSS